MTDRDAYGSYSSGLIDEQSACSALLAGEPVASGIGHAPPWAGEPSSVGASSCAAGASSLAGALISEPRCARDYAPAAGRHVPLRIAGAYEVMVFSVDERSLRRLEALPWTFEWRSARQCADGRYCVDARLGAREIEQLRAADYQVLVGKHIGTRRPAPTAVGTLEEWLAGLEE